MQSLILSIIAEGIRLSAFQLQEELHKKHVHLDQREMIGIVNQLVKEDKVQINQDQTVEIK